MPPVPPDSLGNSSLSHSKADAALAQACFEYALNGILESDTDLHILRANPAALSILGTSQHRLLGKRFDDCFDPGADNRGVVAKHLALLVEQGIARAELKLAPKGNEEGECCVELSSVDIGQGRWLHMFDDVTAQRQLMLATQQARLKAEEASQAKSSFLANMSHEIRTPLNGMIGLSELLRMTRLDDRQADYVGKILQSSRSLLAILNDLLDISKIEAGGVHYENIPLDISALCEELAALIPPMQKDGQPEYSCNIAPGTPLLVAGDPLRLTQILRNLLSNALKFAHRGRVTLSIAAATANDGKLWLRFSVADTGIGMSEAEQARIFLPFSQADVSTTRRFGGTGLGLAISRMLAEGMGGRIDVESEMGEGSTFTLLLPFDPVLQPQAPSIKSETGIGRDEFLGCRALVAEDNAINQLVIGELLRQAGIAVNLAENGREALAALESPTEMPDLIFMDVQMPEMDGLDATCALRANGCTIPVVALTAAVSQAERSACMDAGMSDFLSKPINIEDLAAVLTRWLPARRGRPSQAELLQPQAAGPPDAEFPGLDLDQALPRFLGNREFLSRARDAFLEQHRDSPAQLAELARQNAWPEILRLTHSLRGAAGNLGAIGLSELLSRMESGKDSIELIAAITREFQLLGSKDDRDPPSS